GLRAALDGRAVADLVEPAFEMLELVDVLALGLPVDCPRIANHIGDRVFAAGEVPAIVEAIFHEAVKPVRLLGKAADRIGHIARFGTGTAEMTALAELRALIGHLPHDPLRDLVFSARVLPEKAAFLFCEIHHDRARLEDADRRPAALWLMVDQYRHAVVRVDLQELELELVAAADIAWDEIVVEPQ